MPPYGIKGIVKTKEYIARPRAHVLGGNRRIGHRPGDVMIAALAPGRNDADVPPPRCFKQCKRKRSHDALDAGSGIVLTDYGEIDVEARALRRGLLASLPSLCT
ncbi:hypothetical protein NUTIK01_21250 [Novosphingobium sp. IK01]|uniref:Uncharacterized protein n=1 Tax=Novosphingobium pituita TaxID=3056842 RepID=A0ABQ6P7Z1_9SPHN|nr:hypothetical protein NUTIK01_21250 [Novosphingobium sp. IK01]